MKQLLQALSGDAGSVVRTRRPAAPSYACDPRAAWTGLGFDTTGLTSFAGATSPAAEGHLAHLGANGRMAITATVRRRPPETPT